MVPETDTGAPSAALSTRLHLAATGGDARAAGRRPAPRRSPARHPRLAEQRRGAAHEVDRRAGPAPPGGRRRTGCRGRRAPRPTAARPRGRGRRRRRRCARRGRPPPASARPPRCSGRSGSKACTSTPIPVRSDGHGREQLLGPAQVPRRGDLERRRLTLDVPTAPPAAAKSEASSVCSRSAAAYAARSRSAGKPWGVCTAASIERSSGLEHRTVGRDALDGVRGPERGHHARPPVGDGRADGVEERRGRERAGGVVHEHDVVVDGIERRGDRGLPCRTACEDPDGHRRRGEPRRARRAPAGAPEDRRSPRRRRPRRARRRGTSRGSGDPRGAPAPSGSRGRAARRRRLRRRRRVVRRRAPRRARWRPAPRRSSPRARARRSGSGGPSRASASHRRTGRGPGRGATGRARPRRP